MPVDFKGIYQSIDNEVIWMHSKWVVYNQIFNGSDNIRLLNDSAGYFFGIVQRTFFEDVILGISRLTDPAKTAGKENRSIAQVIEKLNDLGYIDLVEELDEDLENINLACEIIREWRNRRIAHSDLKTNLLVNPDPLPGLTSRNIDEALKLIRKFMNRINGFFFDSETIYDRFITKNGGRALLAKLRLAEDGIKKQKP